MCFLPRRVLHLRSLPLRSLRENGSRVKSNVTSRRASSTSSTSGEKSGIQYNVELVPPQFTQTPPAWVRYAWPIIIANGLLMGSAVDLTWNHWARLVSDLEEIGEKNRAAAAAAVGSSQEVKQEDKPKETFHWEQHPVWLRATFCGLYGVGWALSTVYLLKFKQTYVTKLRFFRSPAISSAKTSSTPKSTQPERKLDRVVHISTASNPTGHSLRLDELILEEGRNETELVIRYQDVPAPGKGGRQRKKSDYWYISLTDAWVSGSKIGDLVTARDNLIWAWDGSKGKGEVILTPDGIMEESEGGRMKQESKRRRTSGWQSGPVLRK